LVISLKVDKWLKCDFSPYETGRSVKSCHPKFDHFTCLHGRCGTRRYKALQSEAHTAGTFRRLARSNGHMTP
jgi:hypothetical protein